MILGGGRFPRENPKTASNKDLAGGRFEERGQKQTDGSGSKKSPNQGFPLTSPDTAPYNEGPFGSRLRPSLYTNEEQ